MTFNDSIRRQARGAVKPHEHDGSDISGELTATSLSPRAIIGLEPGLGVTVAALDTPSDQRRLARFKCDGIADDVQILAAIDEAGDGGEVKLLSGTFVLDEDDGAGNPLFDLAGKTSLTIRGSGRDTTILKPPSTRTAGIEWFHAEGAAGAIGVTLRDMTLDGRGDVGNERDEPISFNDADNEFNRFERLTIKGMDSAGTGPACTDLLGTQSLWFDCYFLDNSHTGLYLTSGHSRVVHCVFRDNGVGQLETQCRVGGFTGTILVGYNSFLEEGSLDLADGPVTVIGNFWDTSKTFAQNGWDCLTTGDASGSVVIGNTMVGVGWGTGITMGSKCVVQGNHIEGLSHDGIEVAAAADDCVVNGNLIDTCGQATDDTYDGIRVVGDRNNVQDNTVRHGGGATQFKNGIQVSGSGAADNLIANNDLLNSGRTASFADTGTTTRTISPTDVVYTENAEAGVSVASTSDVTIATTDVTGVVAGDLLVAEAWFRVFNDSGGTKTYTFTIEMESLTEELGVGVVTGNHLILRFQWILAVVSASESRFQGIVQFDVNSGTWENSTVRSVWNATASDLTGTVTVAFKVKSSNATGTQTGYPDGFVVRKP